MPTVKLYHHGATGGVAPTKNTHERSIRGDVEGWTASSTRSNTRFLYSVEHEKLYGIGFALSLTIRDCPESHDQWHKIRRAFLMRLSRMGLIRCHWLTEWQRRGCPHLHAAVWFEPNGSARGHVSPSVILWGRSLLGASSSINAGSSSGRMVTFQFLGI